MTIQSISNNKNQAYKQNSYSCMNFFYVMYNTSKYQNKRIMLEKLRKKVPHLPLLTNVYVSYIVFHSPSIFLNKHPKTTHIKYSLNKSSLIVYFVLILKSPFRFFFQYIYMIFNSSFSNLSETRLPGTPTYTP